MTEKHQCTEEFPYTTVQLANAILWLSEYMQIVTKMQEIDETEVPE